MKPHHPRMFIGLELEGKDKLQIAQWRDKHLHGLSDKPVPAENFHITLSFLGHVSQDKMEQLHLALMQINAHQFSTTTTHLGTFKKAQVLYLAVDLVEELDNLAKQCFDINKQLALPNHHSIYRPHVTLTRKHKDIVPIEAQPPGLTLSFSAFHLYESVASNKPGTSPHYPQRLSFDLKPKLPNHKS